MPWWVRRWISPSEWRWRCKRFIGFFQRGWRGWADHDVWSFDRYVAGVMAGGMARLAVTKHGVCPSFLPDGFDHSAETLDAADKKQRAWLLDTAEWFDWYARDEDGTSDDKGWITPGMSDAEKRRRIEAYHVKVERFFGEILPSLAKHYGGLWD